MNRLHHWLCRSDLWKRALRERILPWVLDGVELGDDVLELGPGPGAVTDLLRARARRLTAIEIDRASAFALGARLRGSNVRVLAADAVKIPCAENSFSSVICLAMLHHVPSVALQNALFKEVCRVLRPSGIFVGMDAQPGATMRSLHFRDTFVPVNPSSLAKRLEVVGFRQASIKVAPFAFRFRAVAA